MSRRAIFTPESAGYDIIVGWDPPLQTYYGQVMPPGDIGDDELMLWVGKTPRELPTVASLNASLSPWGEVDPQLWAELDNDRETDS